MKDYPDETREPKKSDQSYQASILDWIDPDASSNDQQAMHMLNNMLKDPKKFKAELSKEEVKGHSKDH